MKPSRLPPWKILLTATFIFLLLLEVILVIQQERTQIFSATAQKTGSALINFAETRAQLLQRKTDESFAKYEQRISSENGETQSLYLKLHSVEVARLRDGFARRGLKTPELDEFYQRPGSTIAIREIGRTLFDKGAELRSGGLSAVVKGWWRPLLHLTLLTPSRRLRGWLALSAENVYQRTALRKDSHAISQTAPKTD